MSEQPKYCEACESKVIGAWAIPRRVIRLCPKHAAVDALVKALEGFIEVNKIDNSLRFMEAFESQIKKARAALALVKKSEGK